MKDPKQTRPCFTTATSITLIVALLQTFGITLPTSAWFLIAAVYFVAALFTDDSCHEREVR